MGGISEFREKKKFKSTFKGQRLNFDLSYYNSNTSYGVPINLINHNMKNNLKKSDGWKNGRGKTPSEDSLKFFGLY